MQHADSSHHAHRRHRRPQGALLAVIREILGDGRPRSPHEILADGIARGLVPANITLQQVANAISSYVARKMLTGRKPIIVEDDDRRYRLNHPPDAWPEPASPLPATPPKPAALAALDIVRRTSVGFDPTAFEIAVCNLFGAIGFVATHLGGNPEPDGYIDAPLGVLGYRVVLECKSTALKDAVGIPNAAEPARYREPYHAQACALIGPAFNSKGALLGELHVHGVSVWTVDDLATITQAGMNPHELRHSFEPGFAEDAIADLLWERSHGVRKRVAVISELLQKIASREQHIALTANPAFAARLTVDAAMICVNESLAESGSEARCERADVQAAFDWMTQPLVASAIWTDAARVGIIVTS